MQELKLKVKRITILQGRGPDRIDLELDLATPFPKIQEQASCKFETEAGFGPQWCRDTLGLEPDEVINMAVNYLPFSKT